MNNESIKQSWGLLKKNPLVSTFLLLLLPPDFSEILEYEREAQAFLTQFK